MTDYILVQYTVHMYAIVTLAAFAGVVMGKPVF